MLFSISEATTIAFSDFAGADHLDGDLAGVEEADSAIEHVEGESLCAVRGLHVVVGAESLAITRRWPVRTDELIPIHAGVDEQTERRRVEPSVVEARPGGLHRVSPRARVADWPAGAVPMPAMRTRGDAGDSSRAVGCPTGCEHGGHWLPGAAGQAGRRKCTARRRASGRARRCRRARAVSGLDPVAGMWSLRATKCVVLAVFPRSARL